MEEDIPNRQIRGRGPQTPSWKPKAHFKVTKKAEVYGRVDQYKAGTCCHR
jgi:hypothetical protein